MIQPPRRTILSCAALCLAAASGCATGQGAFPGLTSLAPQPRADVLWEATFDDLDPEEWRNVEVRGRSAYAIVQLDGRSCLEAQSRGSGSILLRPTRYDPDVFETLSWRWRVDRPVDKEDLRRKDGSDAPARVYVYFDTPGLPGQKRSLDYVWSLTLPPGTAMNSPYSSASKIIVVDGGRQAVGQWHTVVRNIEEDYERHFGGNVPYVVAVGVMTDSDNTRGESLAFVDDLRVMRRGGASGPSETPAR